MIAIAPALEGATWLAVIEAEDLRVGESPEELKAMLNSLILDSAARYSNAAPGEIEIVKSVRGILHRAGLDPTRYRASSESLLRRAVKGKGIGFINCVVDLINYYSLKLLLPMGLYDSDRIVPPIILRVGQDGETYEGIGRDALNLARFPLMVDAQGPFGSPISDSVRTRVTEASRNVLWVTFAPGKSDIRLPLDEMEKRLVGWNGGRIKTRIERIS